MKIINNENSVWYKRYQPQCIDDLILPEDLKKSLKDYIQTENLPPIGLFSTLPGTGKSSTANAIIKEINGEALWINASMEGIDILKGQIKKFASHSSFDDKIKIVVMDEFDNMSNGQKSAQKAFRGFLDEYSQIADLFFTANYKEDIIEPLLDRMEVYDFNNFDKKEMIRPIFDRLKFILENEKIQYDPKDLVPVINTFYPRIRSMVGALQRFSKNGVFKVDENDLDDMNVFDNIMQLVNPNTYTEMITSINNINSPDNFYSFLYKNAGKYFKHEKYPNVVLIIAKYQHMSSSVRDKHLNAAACLTELLPLK